MAGSQIVMPDNEAAVWSDFVTMMVRAMRRFEHISLTNLENYSEPVIEAGSCLEVNGSLYQFESNESITGWAGIGNSNDVYIKVVPSGASITAAFTTTAPSWDAAKGGYFNDTDRYIAALRKDGSGNYANKYLLTRPGLLKWHKVYDPATGWIASKTTWATAHDFDDSLDVTFSDAPPGTKAVRVLVDISGTASQVWWRKYGDTTVATDPSAGNEGAYMCLHGTSGMILGAQCVVWLDDQKRVEFCVGSTAADLFIAYPIEYLAGDL